MQGELIKKQKYFLNLNYLFRNWIFYNIRELWMIIHRKN